MVRKYIFGIILLLVFAALSNAIPPRDVYPESEIKRFHSLMELQFSVGTAQGQMLYWDTTTSSWMATATPAAADRITFWDNSATKVDWLTAGTGLNITGTTLAVVDGDIDHGSLAGLGDDDHTQYLLADGSRALAGNWDLGGYNLTNGGTLTVGTLTDGTLSINSGSITSAVDGTFSGTGTFGDLDVDTLNFNGNVISDSTSFISFSNVNLRTDGRIAIGTPATLYPLQISRTYISDQDAYFNLQTETLDPDSNISANVIGHRMSVEVKAGNTRNFTGAVLGLAPRVFHEGTGTMSDVRGDNLVVSNRAGGIITSAKAISLGITNIGLGSITTAYGIYISAIEGTTKWSIYDAAQENSCLGALRIGSTTAPTVALDVTGDVAVSGNTTLGDASTDLVTVTGRWIPRTVASDPTANATAGSLGGIVFFNDKWYGKTVADGTDTNWVALN